MEEKKSGKNSNLEADFDVTTASEGKAENIIEIDEESKKVEIEEEAEEEEVISAKEELEKLQADVEAAKDRMLRTAAEFENYKKRAEREKNEFMKYIATEFVMDLLPIMDNLERAINVADQKETENTSAGGQGSESFREGIKLIYKQLQDVLTKRGVTPIEAVGKPFDPNIHEAVMQAPSDRYPENVVSEEFQKGYMLHDRVIKASMVSVSMGKSPSEEEEKNE
jgi:molecular chaperone GrpE